MVGIQLNITINRKAWLYIKLKTEQEKNNQIF